MKDGELEAKVMRFVREIGIAPDSKVCRALTSRGAWAWSSSAPTRPPMRHLPEACGLTMPTTWRGSGRSMPVRSSIRRDEPSPVPTPSEPRIERAPSRSVARESIATLLLAL